LEREGRWLCHALWGRRMNGLDWVLIGIGILGVLRGLWRGAVSQIFGILGVLGGFLVATHYHQSLAVQLARGFPKLTGAAVISFIALFFLTWLCVAMVGYMVAKVLRTGGLGFMDRVLGAGVGLGKAVLSAIILISILTLFVSPRSAILSQSRLAPQVQEIAQFMVMAAPERLQREFEQKSKELKQYWLEQKRNIARSNHPGKKEKELSDDNE